MYRYHLTCFLALLIALQSVLVIADTHELSQIDSVHVEPKHAHELFSSKDKSHIYEQKGATFEQFFDDCQHCCHCHGHASLVLSNANLQIHSILQGKEIVDYEFNYSSRHSPSLFRPPII